MRTPLASDRAVGSNPPRDLPQSGTPLDCLIVGGGPAGLTAALYLARFARRFMIVDSEQSRAAWIRSCPSMRWKFGVELERPSVRRPEVELL